MKQKSILSILSVVLVVTSLLVVLQVATPITVFAAPATLWVNNTVTLGTDVSCASPGYATISNAVSHAVAGDTINVCTGTYTEQVTIPITLTLTGVPYPTRSSAAPTIQSPAVLTADAFGSLNIVTITGAITVTFQGFTVAGPGPSTCGGINNGIFVEDGATAYVLQNTIEHIRDQPISGCQNGHGISVGVVTGYNDATASTVGQATISGNTIFDYQKGGIDVVNTGSTATITGNTITGVGPTTAIAQNGIEVLYGAVATVRSNTVSGNSYSAACNTQNYFTSCDQSAGILLYDPATSTVQGNEAYKNDVGIWAVSTGTGTVGTVTATSNNVHDNYGYGLVFDGVTGVSQNNFFSKNPVGILVTDSAANAFVTSISDQFVGNTVNTFAYSAPGSFSLTFSVETQPFSFPIPHPPHHHHP